MSTGMDFLRLARRHIGETYQFGASVPKNNANWSGPWDCAEFISWVAFQVTDTLYGCDNDNGNPATADAYTGYWGRDAQQSVVQRVSAEAAAVTPGAVLLRLSSPEQKVGHIVFATGDGGTVEAHSTKLGVIAGQLAGRRWDLGILIPNVTYSQRDTPVDLSGPDVTVYRFTTPHMKGAAVKRIQQALKAAGFNPGRIDSDFGELTQAAVVAFQVARGLLPDGEVGSKTAKALKIDL